MANYVGTSADHIIGSFQNRFFYGLRRTDEGELFIGKVDQLKNDDALTFDYSTFKNEFIKRHAIKRAS